MTDNNRAILSVNSNDIEDIFTTLDRILNGYDQDKLALNVAELSALRHWRNRFFAIHNVLTSDVPIHFTNLGTIE